MTIQNPLVSIITVNYNGIVFLDKLLKSIKSQTYKNIELIVVDNNSTDRSVSYLVKQKIVNKIIKNKTNNGFAQGNNQGAKIAQGKFLFFLNNDTELFPDAVESLVKSYQPKSILTAFQIPSRDTTIQGRAGAGMDIFGYPFSDQKDYSKTKLFYADGAALFIKKKDFILLGMFDEKLFMFQEDIDLSWRAQIYGFKIKSCINAKLYHYYGGAAVLDVSESNQYISSYFRRYLNERNVIRNLLKNYSLLMLIFILPLLAIFHIAEMIFFLVTWKLKAIECYLAAYWWNIKELKDTLKKRNKIQSNRKESDRKLIKQMYWYYSKIVLFHKVGIPTFK